MKKPPVKRLSWLLLGGAALIVLVFLGSFMYRMINPPILPYVEAEGPRSVIQVDVQNASTKNGAGRKVLEFLRERGFDVVEISTSAQTADTSKVIDRLGDRTSALKVARSLGIADSLVYSDIDSMLFVRASVVLGKDIQTLLPFQQ